MVACEFATTLLENGHVVLPETYTKYIPVGSSLRVLVLLNEITTTHETSYGPEEGPSLEEFVKQLKQIPISPAVIQPGNMALLAERLANSLTESTRYKPFITACHHRSSATL